MMKRVVCLLLMAVAGTAALSAEALTVSYVDCDAAARVAGSWVTLATGDAVATDASVRVTGNGLLEMKMGTVTVVFSRPGTYSLSTILAAKRAESSRKISAALTRSVGVLTAPTRSDTVAGVRAEKVDKNDFDWVTDDAADSLDRAKERLEDGDAFGAMPLLDKARLAASADQLPEIGYYRAAAFTRQGKTREALVALSEATARGDESWAADRALLEARLLIDSSAPQAGVDILMAQAARIGTDARRAPLYLFLLAVGNHDRGDDASARAALAKLRALPDDDGLAAPAAELLGN